MKKMKFYIKQMMMFAIVGATAFSIACDSLNGGDDPKTVDEPVASFQLEVDATNFLQVTFTNFSQNATSYTWDFGDGNSSTDESPVHIYAEGGSYTVVLTATNEAGSATKTEKVDLDDPLSTQRKLIGDNGKVWQFVADASTGAFAYQVGPADYSAVWWSLGGAEQLCVRECIMDDTWTFNTDGTFTFENNGDAWAEGIFNADINGGCFDATVAANWVGTGGEDLSAWNSGTHDFTFDPIAGSLVITGGFIGIPKAANNAEVTVPQPTVSYTVVKLVNAEVDTLVLETPIDGGYWRTTLVSYDNPSDKIVIGECAAVEEVNVTFKVDMNDYSGAAFTTVYVTGSFNGWSGDANPMSDADMDGVWEVTLPLPASTDNIEYKFEMDNWAAFEQWDNADLDCIISSDGTNNNRGLSTGTGDMTVSFCFNACSACAGDAFGGAADLVGGWKFAPVAGAMGVGPGQGDTGWWSNDEASVTAARACMFDDVWTFDAAGNFSIQMDGSTYLETWQGVAEGCGTPVAPFDGSGSYTFTADASSITLNGLGAFIGLPKVNNAGELSDAANAVSSITYMVTEYTASGKLTLDIEAGAGVWWRFKLVKN